MMGSRVRVTQAAPKKPHKNQIISSRSASALVSLRFRGTMAEPAKGNVINIMDALRNSLKKETSKTK